MKHCWISGEAKTKAVLEKKGTSLGDDNVDVYRASVILQTVPVEVLTDSLSDPPRAGAQFAYIAARAANVLSKVTSHLTLSFQVHEGKNGGTVSEPKVEGDFYSFYDFLKNKLGATFGKTGNVFPELLVCFREVFSLLWHIR